MAATIQSETGVKSEIVGGSLGQFDIELDGQVIASKKSGLLASKASGGWPDTDLVVAEIEKHAAKTKRA